MKMVLGNPEKRISGETFIPFANYNNDQIIPLSAAERTAQFQSRGLIYWHNPEASTPYGSFIVAEVEERPEFYKKDPTNRDLFQISKIEYELVEIIDFPIDIAQLRPQLPIIAIDPYQGKPVLLRISENSVVGPYHLIKSNAWFAETAGVNESINVYDWNNIINNRKSFIFFDRFFIDIHRLQPIKTVYCFTDAGLLRKFLSYIKDNNTFALTNKDKQHLKALQSQVDSFSTSLCSEDSSLCPALRKRISSIANSLSEIPEIIEDAIMGLLQNQIINQKINDEIENRFQKYLNDHKADIDKSLSAGHKELARLDHDIQQKNKQIADLDNLNRKAKDIFYDFMKNGKIWYDAIFGSAIPIEKTEQKSEPAFSFNCSGLTNSALVSSKSAVELPQDFILYCKQIDLNRFFNLQIDSYNSYRTLFSNLGHQQFELVMHGSAAWLTPHDFYSAEGISPSAMYPVSFNEYVNAAQKVTHDVIYPVYILGADRAPIDGYLGPLMKSLILCKEIAINGKSVKLPSTMLFFIQLDSDECAAPVSKWMKDHILDFPVPENVFINSNIFVTASQIIGKNGNKI